MDLKQFGEQLRTLRQQAGWSQEALIEALDQLARPGPASEYRVIDGTLLSRWERAHTQKGRTWKPTRTYMLHLIQLFASHLDLERAQVWAEWAGYTIRAAELQGFFPTVALNGTAVNGHTQLPDQTQTTSAVPHNLPTLLTSFVGRAAETARVLNYLASSTTRLITVVGEGGTGKTRLALEVARAVVNQGGDQYCDGVYFVALVGVSAASFVVSALANTLGVALMGADEPQQQLLAYLQNQRLLLVLDNFEQLVAEATPLLTAILQAAPGVHLLVTSRERLNLPEEWVLSLAGLPFHTAPKIVGPAPLGALHRPALTMTESYGAVELFVARARQIDDHFDPDSNAEQTAAIGRICHLLQGIPLGIEMAAAWVHMLSCAEIGDEIARNLDFLTSPHRHVPERHRSMRAVFEHSWRLLTRPEQTALAALAVFQGGFTREAAASVAKASLVTLRSLVDKSLLKVNEGRYELHELLRQFAAEKLQLDPTSEESVERRHTAYYGEILKRDENLWYTEHLSAHILSTRVEIQNIRSGWHWAVTNQAWTVLDQYMESLIAFYMLMNWYQEGRDTFQFAIAHLELLARGHLCTDRLLGKSMSRCAHFEVQLGQHEIAAQHYQQSLLLFQNQQDRIEACFCLIGLGKIYHLWGKYREAQSWFTKSLAMAEDTGNVIQKADANYFLGEVALAVGDYAEADYRYQCGLEFYRSQNSEHGIGLVLSGKGKVAQALGRDTTAESFYQQSLLLFERLENRKDIAQVSLYLGTIAQAAGDYAKTEAYYQRAYHLAMEIHLPVVSTQALCCLALLTCQYGQRQQAQAYLRSAWDIASSQRRDPLLLEVGLTTAMVLLAQLSETHLLPGEAVESRRTVELAYRLLSFVANHSAALFKTRNQAEMKLAELLNMLPSSAKDELSAQTPLPKLEEFSSSWKNLVSPAT